GYGRPQCVLCSDRGCRRESGTDRVPVPVAGRDACRDRGVGKTFFSLRPAAGKYQAILTAAPVLRAEVMSVVPPPISCRYDCAARSISCIPVSPMAYRVGPNELIPAPAAPANRIVSRRPVTSRGWKESSIFLN